MLLTPDEVEFFAHLPPNYKYHYSPLTLVKRMNPDFIVKKFHQVISDSIRRCVLTPNGRLIISAPPRTGKSELGSKATPIWTLDTFPSKRVIMACVTEKLATSFSKYIKEAFRTYGDGCVDQILWNKLKSDSQALSNFQMESGNIHQLGGMYSLGVTGSVIGFGGDLIIVDDFISDHREALNPRIHDDIWDWFNFTLRHRLEPGGSMLIIATRWHEDDLIGRLLANERNEWEYLELPALAYEDDILGRKPGEALFPERYDEEHFAKSRIKYGNFFNAVFQQRPTNATNSGFNPDNITIIDGRDDMPDKSTMKFCRAWDLGGSSKQTADPSVGILFGFDTETGNFYVMDVWRDRKDSADLQGAIFAKARADRLIANETYTVYMEQEGGASGGHLSNFYENEFKKIGIPFKGVPAGNSSKEIKSLPFMAAVGNKSVYMIKQGWNDRFLSELSGFPKAAKNDDQVDCCSLGYLMLTEGGTTELTFGDFTSQASVDSEVDDVGYEITFGDGDSLGARDDSYYDSESW